MFTSCCESACGKASVSIPVAKLPYFHQSAVVSSLLSAEDESTTKSMMLRLRLQRCRGLTLKVKYAGVANNAVRAAFQNAGFKKTSKPQWNVLWSKALKPEAYSTLTRFQRVGDPCCSVLCCAGLVWAVLCCAVLYSGICQACHAVHVIVCQAISIMP